MNAEILCSSVLTLALVAAVGVVAYSAPTITAGRAQSELKVKSVEFEPVGEGKNVVRLKVSNRTSREKVFAVHIQTRSRMGWGRQYFSTVRAGKTDVVRCAFCINGPVEKDTRIRLQFYDPGSEEDYDFDQYFQQQRFTAADLPLGKARKLTSLPDSDTRVAEAREAFKELQHLIRQERYQDVWDGHFSKDYRDAGLQSFESFTKAMTGVIPYFAFYWDRDALLGMRPASASRAGDIVVLSVTDGSQKWEVDFVPSAGGWRVDWISGYEPAILRIPRDWEKPLLEKTEKLSTDHFDIHYFKGSTAEREIDSLATARERGYAGVVDLLGAKSDARVRLILFEDMKAKFLNTGHQGMGLASGNTIVEVYNEKDRLDAYHETTHVLMRSLGSPPAIFSEGVAVYMSERLGAPPLRNLGGGDQSLYARCRDLKQKGEWIPLKELLTYTEIGSEESRPAIAYAEAGAFVKYLIERFGKDVFLAAYKMLANSDDPQVHRRNQEELERITGLSLQKLEKSWEQAFQDT